MNNIFNYKIVELKNNIKVGFPLNNMNMVISKLKELNINYIIVENKQIIDEYNNDKNKYRKYLKSVFKIISLNSRINKITERIKLIKNDDAKDKILLEIEDILDKIE